MRKQPISMNGEEFRHVGHQLVDTIANLLDHIGTLPVSHAVEPRDIKAHLPKALPENGGDATDLLGHAATVLLENSTITWHPKFWGYINGSAAPLGVLGDMLASAINPNVGGWTLSPAATEIEKQTIAWIGELVGYGADCGGVLVSGGNMANMLGFFAALTKARSHEGATAGYAYASVETHTWLEKAAALVGAELRSIGIDAAGRIDVSELRRRISDDVARGEKPVCVVATAGTVAIGAIDPIAEIADLCAQHGIWLHVDGAYGAPAYIAMPEHPDLQAMARADSLAVDPHKWLYAPFEAGCTLVRNPQHLLDAFSHRPSYYKFDGSDEDPRTSFYELGMQNSRGFRALKVWLLIQHAGRAGYARMIGDDMALSRRMYDVVSAHPDFEVLTQGLSIATFRYVPRELASRATEPAVGSYLDELNSALLSHLQAGGPLFVSNAVVQGKYVLRACITNWRTTEEDVDAVPGLIAEVGAKLHEHMKRQIVVSS